MKKVAFLHTVDSIVSLFPDERLPSFDTTHLVDESLLADARAHGTESVADRVAARIEELQADGPDVICCTCSTIGDLAEATAGNVFRVDRPMMERAKRDYDSIAVIAAHPSTWQPTLRLLFEKPAPRHVVTRLADELTDAVAEVAPTVDVIVLAQASMATAGKKLGDVGVPILNSPGEAIRWLADYATA